MTRSDLEDAAFCEHRVCLNCTATFDASREVCPICGSEETADAKKVLELINLITAEE